MTTSKKWQFWIDRGGTFTDLVAYHPDLPELVVHKRLSVDDNNRFEAPIEAIHAVLNEHGVGGQPCQPSADTIEFVKMGTTVATNALLEDQGEPVCLLINRGFGDLVEIGRQSRPELFRLNIKKPGSAVKAVIEVDGRVDVRGHELERLAIDPLRDQIRAAMDQGFRCFAVALMHSWAFPEHEKKLGALLAELGVEYYALSHETAPEIRLLERCLTTVVDVSLTPILQAYIEQLRSELDPEIPLYFMQSNGGLISADQFRGKSAILSGPAGGVVACAHIAKQFELEQVIGFDMGGTSTDVCRYAGQFEQLYENEIAGRHIQAPMLNIETVAAGGGSLLGFQDGRLTVGPESAGAKPGPVCYGRNGKLAITDANLTLGRLQPDYFPHCFGPESKDPLSSESAIEAFLELAQSVKMSTGKDWSPEELAAGYLKIANETMAKPIARMSLARGYDVRDHALISFGGAGGQHACGVADCLGIREILLHPLSGVLSAYGMGLADFVHTSSCPILKPIKELTRDDLESAIARLKEENTSAFFALILDQLTDVIVDHKVTVEVRAIGANSALAVPWESFDSVKRDFAREFERLYGFECATDALEIVNLRLDSSIASSYCVPELERTAQSRQLLIEAASDQRSVLFFIEDELKSVQTPLFARTDLREGDQITGPALIIEETGTIVVEPNWELTVAGSGVLRMTRRQLNTSKADREVASMGAKSSVIDPVTLEVFNQKFMAIAEQMGATLQRVSHSTNIKERLDFSCALFDKAGELIANAPHIPVHLGAMGESVKSVVQIAESRQQKIQPGDAYLCNDPYSGGSHLPDLTIVSPFFNDQNELEYFVANRGHHADIGGTTPGSMPPWSTEIGQEGKRFAAFKLVSQGQFNEQELLAEFQSEPWPVRNIPERLSDLRAQLAANQTGIAELQRLCHAVGFHTVSTMMSAVRDNAELAMRQAIARIPDGEYSFTDALDEGAQIRVAIEVAGDRARLDFTGTSPQLTNNLNAPKAVVKAAILYSFRCLIDHDVPLNAGCLAPIDIMIPEKSMLSPEFPAPVVGGNVETSQRIVDVIFGALRHVSASQGTMNNFIFGNNAQTPAEFGEFGYYETIAGGAGAGYGFDGANAVQTHMTNTRITDPEVVELRYPVRVRQFRVRRKSGGAGVWRGGDGVVREFEFLAPVTVSILSQRRALRPYGLNHASPGTSGRNVLLRSTTWSSGVIQQDVANRAELDVGCGDRVQIHSPGGGGFNPRREQWREMTPAMLRKLARFKRYNGPTAGIAAGYQQANMVVIPARFGDEFEEFCHRNSQACPLLFRGQPGQFETPGLAVDMDLRTDLPGYIMMASSKLIRERRDSIEDLWHEDSTAFLLGCSFSFEEKLQQSGLTPRHVELRQNVPMYRTDRSLVAVGPFSGPLIVSMRPYPLSLIDELKRITEPLVTAHGGPIAWGDPAQLGIRNINRPDFGEAVPIKDGEVPVFWACGVSSQISLEAALQKRVLPSIVAHAPGHMAVLDVLAEQCKLWNS